MTSSVVYPTILEWDRDYYFERLLFAAMLEDYVVPRPKTYANRKWLEGYCEGARFVQSDRNTTFHWLKPAQATSVIVSNIINGNMKLTAKVNGQIDAWLDAIGC